MRDLYVVKIAEANTLQKTKTNNDARTLIFNTGKPGARAGDSSRTSQGPMHPLNFPSKPTDEEAKFRYQAAMESSVRSHDFIDRVLNSKITVAGS